ncbi:coiled-coil domain-containing protein 121 [Marmota marmota marmota]|uniref:DUF4515 domain-containing protein n=1 Tax=Marmota marmota marmota TaxID=9994 RepID=A0A8C6A3W3_MARMA|nr:coiled-coil domain-containing protein 121 [Marmota marmota marmota]
MASHGQDSRCSKTRSEHLFVCPKAAGYQTARGAAARPHLSPEVLKLLISVPATSMAVCDLRSYRVQQSLIDHRKKRSREPPVYESFEPRRTLDTSARSSAVTLTELQSCPSERLDSGSRFAETHMSPHTSAYLSMLHKFFTPDKLTKWEKRVKGKTVLALKKLNKEMEEVQIHRDLVLEECRALHKEKLLVEADSKFFLEYLAQKNKHCRQLHEDLWKEYFQKCGAIEKRRQELSSKYAKQTSDLKAQQLQGKKTQANLKEQLKALKNISKIKEKQDMRIESLEKEKEKIKAETPLKDQKAHLQFLQQKALLEKQLTNPYKKQSGERKKFIKAQTLESIAQKSSFEFCRGVYKENLQLQEELLQLLEVSKKLKAARSQLENQKQELEQEQWYQECLIRGKQRLQAKPHWCPKEEGATKTTLSPISTKARIKSKVIPKIT